LAAVFLLALTKAAVRERVLPSEAIPVINVLAQDDNFGAADRLFVRQPQEQLVGGRATRAPFGSE
jgi:hypothetical protein